MSKVIKYLSRVLEDPTHPEHDMLRSVLFGDLRHEIAAARLIEEFFNHQTLEEWKKCLKKHPPSPETIGYLIVLAVESHQSKRGRRAANKRHNEPGGSRDKRNKIREIWARGNYSSRAGCAEEECDALKMAYETARKALRNTPNPNPWPAKGT